jgi:hypothetical protein
VPDAAHVKDFQAARKDFQIRRKDFQARRKEIQMRSSEVSRGYAGNRAFRADRPAALRAQEGVAPDSGGDGVAFGKYGHRPSCFGCTLEKSLARILFIRKKMLWISVKLMVCRHARSRLARPKGPAWCLRLGRENGRHTISRTPRSA